MTRFQHREAQELFSAEFEGWIYGLSSFGGKVYPALVQQVIKEFSPALQRAVLEEVALDLVQIVEKLSGCARDCMTPRAIALHLLIHLPDPRSLDENRLYVLASSFSPIEERFPGILASAEQIWSRSRKLAA